MIAAIGGHGAVAAESRVQPELGLQAFTYRTLNFDEVMEKASALGISTIQAYPNLRVGDAIEPKFNHNMDEATRARVRAKMKAKGIRVPSYGVVRGKDEAEWRRVFAFAVALGMTDIAAEPTVEFLPLLERLSQETGVRVALHNHPAPARYADPTVTLAAIAPFGTSIGLCADTGHWARSGFDPVTSLRQAEGRIISLHFKDLAERGVKTAFDAPWGTGVCDAAGQILELRRQRFAGVVYIEYERISATLDDEVRRCVEYFHGALAATDEDLRAGRVLTSAATPQPVDGGTDPRGRETARPLFAPDLSNADFKPGTWAWEGDALVAKGIGDLWTKESYGNFVLSLEFRCDEQTNSGVVLRMSDMTDWINNSLEVQILQGEDPMPSRNLGAVFDVLAPRRRIAAKPGEWHRFVITARAATIEVALDGQQIVKMDLNDWPNPGQNPDGSRNRFKSALRDLAREGRIGLQYHGKGAPIAFRNLLVERL
jgi:sugar phosphate isomerase/epimerase